MKLPTAHIIWQYKTSNSTSLTSKPILTRDFITGLQQKLKLTKQIPNPILHAFRDQTH
jgi:hypothetical protein